MATKGEQLWKQFQNTHELKQDSGVQSHRDLSIDWDAIQRNNTKAAEKAAQVAARSAILGANHDAKRAGQKSAEQIVIDTAREQAEAAKKAHVDYKKSEEAKQAQRDANRRALDEAARRIFAVPGASASDIPLTSRDVWATADPMERELKHKADNAEKQVQDAENQAVIAQNLEELETWSEEDRKALDTYIIEREQQTGDIFGQPQFDKYNLNPIVGKYGDAKVRKMAEALEWSRSQQMAQQVQEAAQSQNKVAANALSVGTNLVGAVTAPIEYAREMGRRTGQFSTLNPNNIGALPNIYTGAVRQATTEAIQGGEGENNWLRNLAAVAYQGGMGFFDNTARLIASGGNAGVSAIIAAGSSFGNSLQQYSAQGASPEQAAAMALINAGLEYATEKVSDAEMLDFFKSGGDKKKVADFLWHTFGVEPLSEEINLFAGTAAEAMVLAEKSGMNQRIGELVAGGMSYEEARNQVIREFLKEAGQTYAVSTISAGVQSGVAAAHGRNATTQVVQPGQSANVQQNQTVQQTQEATANKEQMIAKALAEATNQQTQEATQTAVDAQQNNVSSPLENAVQKAISGGGVSNSMAEAILNDPESLRTLQQQTGTEITGTKAEQRRAVKAAIDQLAGKGKPSTEQALANALADVTGKEPAQIDKPVQTQQTVENVAPVQQKSEPEVAQNAKSTPVVDTQNQSPEGGQIKGTGAAEANFSGVANYENMLSEGNSQPERAGDVRSVEMPKVDSDGRRVTEFASNVVGAAVTPDSMADAVKSLVGDKKLSFDTVSNRESLNKAAQSIQKTGEQEAYNSIHDAVQSKSVPEGTIEKGLVLYAKYANDKNMQDQASSLITDLATLANRAGRDLQLFSMLQRMTPEGRLMAVQKNVNRYLDTINEGRSARKQVTGNDRAKQEQKATQTAVAAARKEAGKAVTKAPSKVRYKGGKVTIDSNQAGEPFVYEYAQKVGEALAKGLESKTKPREKVEKTFMQNITAELRRFANEKLPKKPGKKGLTATELLRDYVQQPEFFAEAWEAAQLKLREQYGNHPALEGFLNSGIGVDGNTNPRNAIFARALANAAMESGETAAVLRKQDALGFTNMAQTIADELISKTGATGEIAETIRDAARLYVQEKLNDPNVKPPKTDQVEASVRSALQDIQTSMDQVARSNSKSKTAARDAVIQTLINKYGFGRADASRVADVVGGKFDTMAQERATAILEQKFGEREKAKAQSAGEKAAELSNLGAFNEDSAYTEKAAESVIRSAMADIGTTLSEYVKTKGTKGGDHKAEIASMLVKKYGLSSADASRVADVVSEQFAQMAQQRATEILESRFKERQPGQKKTTEELLREYANLGAFDAGSEYNEKATAKIVGERYNAQISEALAQDFLNAKTEAEQEAAMDAIYKDIASQTGATLEEMWDGWRNLSMLGNVKTHGRNFGSTGAFQPFVSVKRGLGAIIERVAGVDQADRTKAILGVGKEAKALKDWARADAKTEATKKLMEYSGTTGDNARTEIEDRRKILPTIFGIDLDKARKGNMKVMEAEDMFWKRSQYSLTLASFLKARGYTAEQVQNGQVPAGVLNEGRELAVKEAMKATFNDQNRFSNTIAKMRVNGSDPASKALNILLKGIQPFSRTPANVAVRAFEYSPLGIAKGLNTAVNKVKTGEATMTDAIDQLASGLTGTGALLLGNALASGLIPGVKLIGGELTEEEEDEGAQKWSIKIGNQYFSLAWIAPATVPLFVGANLYRNVKAREEAGEVLDAWDVVSALFETGADVLDPLLELSMMSSWKEAIEAMEYEETAGDKALALVTHAATSYLTQGLPTIFGQLEQATETTKTTTFANADNPLEREWQRIAGRASQRIPGLDLYQTEKVDEFGNVVQNEGTPLERAFNAIVNPFTVSKEKDDPVIDEIARLRDAAPDGANPPEVPKKISYTNADGEKVRDHRLTAEEYNTYSKVQGQTIHSMVEECLDNDAYKAMPEKLQAKVRDYIYDYAREKARSEAIQGYEIDTTWMQDVDSVEAMVRRVADNSISDAISNGSTEELEQAMKVFQALPVDVRADMLKNSGGRIEYFLAANNAGVDAQTFLDLYGQYKAIDDTDKEIGEKSDEWKYVLTKAKEAGTITNAQKNVMMDNMQYWVTFPGGSDNFENITSKNVKADKAKMIIEAANSIIPPKGKEKPTQEQYAKKFAGMVLSDHEKAVAMTEYLNDGQDKNLRDMMDEGYSPDEYAVAYSIYSGISGSRKKNRTIAALQEELGIETYKEAETIYYIFSKA